ncbi:serpin family protein [uncultured Sphaerochaeta sp.]|uniref:serpin family protein n=1 Tax=uncultured Sphaerochaeta sp. TaxID=886478 RepID=UPI002A0A4932|nr:serpin family protein [uncultured Sphaerochaeta sp.]
MKRYLLLLCFLSVGSLLLGNGYKATENPKVSSITERPMQISESYFKDSVNQFSDSLFLSSSKKTGNIMVSPISVFLALGMTANGAEGQTKETMLKVLTNSEYPLQALNEKSKSYLDSIEALDNSITLNIANSLWLQKNLKVGKQFLQSNKDFFRASVESLDFSKAQSVDIINNWVNDSTKGAIDSILDSLDPGAVMYLINAIYFKADWSTPFERSSTYDETFFAQKGEIKTPFMYRNGTFLYSKVADSQAVVLPYENERFAFFALLPDSPFSVRQWLERQSDSPLSALLDSMMRESAHKQIALSIPKFEARYKDSLSGALKGMGMSIAFNSQLADFSLMTENKTKDIVLDEILHKTFIRVDEKGSEAAAVTAVMMRATCMPIISMPLIFDRPFLYGIMDVKEGIPLFLGIMDNPSQP